MSEHDGWSEARIRHAEESLRAAVEKADTIIEKARERAVRDAATEDDEMLDPLNRNDSVDTDDSDDAAEHGESPLLRDTPAARRDERPSYLRDAW